MQTRSASQALSSQTVPGQASPGSPGSRRVGLAAAVLAIVACDGAVDTHALDSRSSDGAALDGGAAESDAPDVSSGADSAPDTAGSPTSLSEPWPLSLTGGPEHGFPSEQIVLDCDPAQYTQLSPALLRETSSVVAVGVVTRIEIPPQSGLDDTTCPGDRWNGLTLTISIEESTGPFGAGVGEDLAFHVPSDQLSAWARQPYWNATTGTAHWSPWDTGASEPVPLVGGRVLIAATAVTPNDASDVRLQPHLLFAISQTGTVTAQQDARGACRSRLYVDDLPAGEYGTIESLWPRIAEDVLSPSEEDRAAAINPAVPLSSRAIWVQCAD